MSELDDLVRTTFADQAREAGDAAALAERVIVLSGRRHRWARTPAFVTAAASVAASLLVVTVYGSVGGGGGPRDMLAGPPSSPAVVEPPTPSDDEPARCGPGLVTPPCGPGVEPGAEYPYVLQTHCGVKGLYADGRQWVPEGGQELGASGAPAGLEDPEDVGSLRRTAPAVLEYRSSSGVVLRFVPGDIPADTCA